MSYFNNFRLNDNAVILSPAYGTGTVLKGRDAAKNVLQAIQSGLRHIDCAQFYENEESVGKGIKASGVPREELYITTKYATGDIRETFRNSLLSLEVDYVDLFLIHSAKYAQPHGLMESWDLLEELKDSGKIRSIGVSNYRVDDLKQFVDTAKYKPAVNQIEFHPFVYGKAKELLSYCQSKGILVASYGGLSPITKIRHEDFDDLLNKLSQKYNLSHQALLYNWARAHNVMVVTTSSKAERLEEIKSLSGTKLDQEDVEELDRIGEKYHHRYYMSFMDEKE
ncbi:NADH/NADPH dependent indole-3-acetaldehyde reductase AKR3C2 [Wallemia mellicola]|nr:NADH/NADPH dependent indole-3-acetaldehyde reductase AKR3C2 [Wallemia mellicola]TIC23414.1 NADH/NADPH dependent indole-3-acetaldehyde reductase AKR3C2 [Wallemia mellicola]